MAKVGRNDPCPCGSGKKFKQCCAGKTQKVKPAGWATIAAIVVAALVILYFVVLSPSGDGGPPVGRACPPGTTWAHGHCHAI